MKYNLFSFFLLFYFLPASSLMAQEKIQLPTHVEGMDSMELVRQNKIYQDYIHVFKAAYDSASYDHTRAWFDNNGMDSLITKEKQLMNDALVTLKSAQKVFIKKHPDFAISAVLMRQRINEYFKYTREELEELRETLKNNPDTADYNVLVRNMEHLQKLCLGADYNDFTAYDANKNKVQLSSLVEKGKYTLIDFWASWCGPCRWAIPKVKALYEANKDRLNVISCSLDEKEEKWREAMKEENMPWKQLWVNLKDPMAQQLGYGYMISSIPRLMLISPDGKIACSTHLPEELELK